MLDLPETQNYYDTSPYYVRMIAPEYYAEILAIDQQQDGTVEGRHWSDKADLEGEVLQLRFCVLVALSGSTVVGYLVGDWPNGEGEEGLATLHHVAVDEAHRRRGVGFLLMSQFGERIMRKSPGLALVHKQDRLGSAFLRATGWEARPEKVISESLGWLPLTSGPHAGDLIADHLEIGDYVRYSISRRSLETMRLLRWIKR